MEDNGRVYKDAYRTCKREYDSLEKKYAAAQSGASVSGMLKWMLPVLLGTAVLFVLVYILLPACRVKAVGAFICVEVGLLLSFGAYFTYSILSGRSGQDNKRMERLASILEELDEAWLANDANEAAKRRITAERQGRQQAGQYSVRERVLSNTQLINLQGEVKDDE